MGLGMRLDKAVCLVELQYHNEGQRYSSKDMTQLLSVTYLHVLSF